MAPFLGDDGVFSSPTSYYPPSAQSSLPDPVEPPKTSINIPLIAISISLVAFLLICFSVCACAYRRAKSRTRTIYPNAQGEYVGLGEGYGRDVPLTPLTPFPKAIGEGEGVLNDDDDEEEQHQPPPAYSPNPVFSRRSLRGPPPALGLTATPTLTLSPSPALASAASPAYSLSPALSPGLSPHDGERAKLLALMSPPTPPPPMYMRK